MAQLCVQLLRLRALAVEAVAEGGDGALRGLRVDRRQVCVPRVRHLRCAQPLAPRRLARRLLRLQRGQVLLRGRRARARRGVGVGVGRRFAQPLRVRARRLQPLIASASTPLRLPPLGRDLPPAPPRARARRRAARRGDARASGAGGRGRPRGRPSPRRPPIAAPPVAPAARAPSARAPSSAGAPRPPQRRRGGGPRSAPRPAARHGWHAPPWRRPRQPHTHPPRRGAEAPRPTIRPPPSWRRRSRAETARRMSLASHRSHRPRLRRERPVRWRRARRGAGRDRSNQAPPTLRAASAPFAPWHAQAQPATPRPGWKNRRPRPRRGGQRGCAAAARRLRPAVDHPSAASRPRGTPPRGTPPPKRTPSLRTPRNRRPASPPFFRYGMDGWWCGWCCACVGVFVKASNKPGHSLTR